MTVEEILADLRDIQLPATEVTPLGTSGFDFWPLAMALVMLAVLLMLRRWRAGATRRRLLHDLNAFISAPETRGISDLLVLRSQVARHGVQVPSLPRAFFGPPDELDPASLREAGETLKGLVRR